MRTDYFLIAEILRPHGIKGEVKIKSHSEDLDNLMQVKTLYIKENNAYCPIEAEGFRLHSGEVLLQIKNVYDRNTAERYRNTELYIARTDASPLEEGEFYISDILGIRIVDREGNELGVLKDVLTSYATYVYQVRCKNGTFLFPAIDKVFVNVDIDKGVMVLDEQVLSEIATYED